jgi:cobalamin biosynthesis Mg chelatase CobN
MHGKRHRRLSLGRRLGGLLAMSLLSALLIPVAAQGAESGEIEYQEAPPTPTVHDKTPSGGGGANGSAPGGGSSPESSPNGPGGAHKGGRTESGGSSPHSKKAGGGKTGLGQGSRVGSEGQAGIGGSEAFTSNSAGSGSGGGGSSPLVPILIAVAVLAAITIGVVMMRQRRGTEPPSSPASPKAN